MDKLGRWQWNQWQPLDYLGALLFWLIMVDMASLLAGELRLALFVAYGVGAVMFVMVALFVLILLTMDDWEKED